MREELQNLTEQQRKCLRLVARGRSSKEIAIALGLSPNTVDRYIFIASSQLGATNRRDAAQRLTALEALPQYKEFIYHSRDIASSLPAMISPGTETEDPSQPEIDPEAQFSSTARYGAGGRTAALDPDWLVFPIGGADNDLTSHQRIAAIVRLSLYSAIAVTATLVVAKGAFSLLG